MGKSNVYSEEDLSYIRENYDKVGITELAAHVGVCHSAMHNQLARMGLEMSREGCPWRKDELDKFRALVSDNKTVAELSSAMGRTEKAVMNKARQLGIKIKDVAGKWSLEDKETLRRCWGRRSLSHICSKLNRTESAVIAQAYVLKLPKCYLESEDIPLSEFCRDTGISRGIIKTLTIKHDFPLKSKKPGKKRIYQYVDSELILPWLEAHQDLYSAANIPLYYFGEDPEWLIKKRREDFDIERTEPNHYKWWSDEDLQKLRDAVTHQVSYESIAEELGRSVRACMTKASQLGLGYSSDVYWRGHEFKALEEGVKTKTYVEIAAELGRSKSSVTHHGASLGLSRKTVILQKRESDKEYIKRHWKKESDAEMANKLDRSKRSVCDLRLELGLHRKRSESS